MKKLLLTVFIILISCSSFAQDYNPESIKKVTYKDLRFTLGGGYAHRLGKTLKTGDRTIDKMTDELLNGFNLDVEGQYFFKEHWGLGFNMYYNSQSSNSYDVMVDDYIMNNAKETTSFVYIGPTFNMRYNASSKISFYGSFGFGPLFFTDKISWNGPISGKYNKTAFASYVSLSTDYSFTNNVAAGLKISVGGGTISGNDYGTDERLSLSNFMITAYLSFRTSK